MRRLLLASIVTTVALMTFSGTNSGAATVTTPAAVHRSYGIHYDGPMVHHGHSASHVQSTSRLASDVTGSLPTFHMTFHGGPVQTSTVSYAIYWQPAGSYMSPTYKPLLNRFLRDVGGSAIYDMATTYTGSNGRVKNVSAFGGSWVDRSPYPRKTISDLDLQIEVLKAISANNWPAGVNTQFYVMTGKNALPAINFCAYHSAFDYGFPPQVQSFVYAFIPYVGNVNGCNVPFNITPNNDVDADGSILNLSHEQMEMVTDPLLNAWYDDNNGEVGDICIFSFGVPIDNVGGNIDIGADSYFLQEDFSAARSSCQPNL